MGLLPWWFSVPKKPRVESRPGRRSTLLFTDLLGLYAQIGHTGMCVCKFLLQYRHLQQFTTMPSGSHHLGIFRYRRFVPATVYVHKTLLLFNVGYRAGFTRKNVHVKKLCMFFFLIKLLFLVISIVTLVIQSKDVIVNTNIIMTGVRKCSPIQLC